jgi:uncharacterized protein (DUF488 family)
MANAFYTIGHSTHSIPDFVRMLTSAGARQVVDVRTVPRSRTNPQFNRDVLPASLAECEIAYEHIASLGGLRGRARNVAKSPNSFWENQSFRNYADYALGESFQAGFARLRELGRDRPCAIMCAEALWWRCHRRIIADYLLCAGESVLHIMGDARIEPAKLTIAARPCPDGTLIYPAPGASVDANA